MHSHLLVVDTDWLAIRALRSNAANQFVTHTGTDLSPVIVAARGIAAVARQLHDGNRVGCQLRLLLCRDGIDATWPRQQIDSRYKKHRNHRPVSGVVDDVCDLFDDLGVPVASAERYEADDMIAAAARHARAVGWQTTILSGDRDHMQLVTDTCDLYRAAPGKKLKRWTPETVEADLGVKPSQVPMWLALAGDGTDWVEGVPGIGPKRATQICNGTASARTRTILDEHQMTFRTALQIVTLTGAAPLPENWTDGTIPTVETVEQVQRFWPISQLPDLVDTIWNRQPAKDRHDHPYAHHLCRPARARY